MSSDTTVSSSLKTAYPILLAICSAHFINDLLQIVLQTNFPQFKEAYRLSYSQIGIITLTFQMTSSVLQPFVGNYTDKHPKPYSFVVGMTLSMIGIISLAYANDYISILISAALIGMGSSIFHPEASKLAFYASGGKRGLAQSIFQIGGNAGTAVGPLLVAALVVKRGQQYISVFALFAVMGIILLFFIGKWYKNFLTHNKRNIKKGMSMELILPKKQIRMSFLILLILIFSKYFYTASITSYLHLYLMEKFHFTVEKAQGYLFAYLFAVAVGTLIGGPIGDKIGRKYVIWISVLGVAPFALLLPFANSFWALILLIIIGVIIASAFPAIIVYAQELLPGRTGMVSGFFYGFAFGMGGIGAAFLGELADQFSLNQVFHWCAYLPLLGLLTVYLPNLKKSQKNTVTN